MSKIRDVVCGMMVSASTVKSKSEYKGQTYYFCAPGCKTAFDQDPKKYVRQEGSDNPGHDRH